MQRLLLVLGQRKYNFGVIEMLSVKLQLSHLKRTVVVNDAQRIIVRAHLKPVDVRENALSAETETTFALFIAIIAPYGKVVEHLRQSKSRLVVGELYLTLVEELDHNLDIGRLVIAPEHVLQKLAYNGLSGIVLGDTVYVYSASAGIHIVEIVLEGIAVDRARFQFLLNIVDDRLHTLLVARCISLKKIAEQLFHCFIALAHYLRLVSPRFYNHRIGSARWSHK